MMMRKGIRMLFESDFNSQKEEALTREDNWIFFSSSWEGILL